MTQDKIKSPLRIIQLYYSKHTCWVRLFGRGFHISNTPMLFSEREGITKTYPLPFGWRFKFLRKHKTYVHVDYAWPHGDYSVQTTGYFKDGKFVVTETKEIKFDEIYKPKSEFKICGTDNKGIIP